MAKGEVLLQLSHLDAFYGRAQALFGVDLTVAAGETVVVMGRNGVGKSTLLKAIVNLVAARGERRFNGRSLAAMSTAAIARLGIGYVPEERRIFPDLTVLENIDIGRWPAQEGQIPWSLARLWRLFPPLEPLQERLGGTLSGGEQQMLCIARTLVSHPRLLLLDEPSEGLAPALVDQLIAGLQTLKEEQMTILLAEQNLRVAKALGDRRYSLEGGGVVSAGEVP